MSEETATAEPEVEVAKSDNAIESLPEEQMDFSSALDAAFSKLEAPQDPEPQEETQEETQEEPQEETKEKNEKVTEEKTEEDAGEEPESKEDLESFDPTDALEEEIGDDWTPKAASRFKQLKEELKSSNDELEALRQQVAEADSKLKEFSGDTSNESIEALQEKLADFESQKMMTDLESTQAYKDAVTDPLDKLIDETKEIADKYQVSADDLVDALAEKDQQRQDELISEILSEATDRDRARVYRILEDLDPILKRREDMFNNASEALNEAKLAEERKIELAAAEKLNDRKLAAKNVVSRVQKKLPFLSSIDGLDMKAIQEKAAEVDPSVIHPVDYTYNSVSAQILPSVIREYMSMRKENEVLTDRLAEYEGAEPTMSGSAPSSGSVSDDMTFEERVESAFANA